MPDVQGTGATAVPDDVELIEPENRATTLKRPDQPSKEEVEKHELLHDPPMPWCEICMQAKGRDECHRPSPARVVPVVQIDYGEAGTDQIMPNFEFVVGTDLSSGASWASVVCVKGQEAPT